MFKKKNCNCFLYLITGGHNHQDHIHLSHVLTNSSTSAVHAHIHHT